MALVGGGVTGATPPSPVSSTFSSSVASIARGRRKNGIATFTVETEAGTNYLIKLVNFVDERDQIMI